MTERIIQTNGVEIATEAFGDPANPPMLLVMGAMASMLWWPAEFCERLAARGFFVIRYDNRDTGLSTTSELGKPDYSKDDMAEDALGILDAYGIGKAHVVGMSLGGMVAQIATLDHPERVRSLTLISTEPIGVDNSHLPPMPEAYAEHGARGADVDWSDREQTIAYVAADMRMIASTAHPHDASAARAFLEQDYDRATRFQSGTNHFMIGGGEGRDIRALSVPLLVMHGESDPVFSVENGRLSAASVPGAELLVIKGGGHEMHPADWEQIITAVGGHAGKH